MFLQHTIRILCAFIVLTLSISAQKQPNFAPDAYKKLASLAGDWVGKDEQGEEVKSNFKLAISNTVVMETLNASGMEEMLTLYSVDGFLCCTIAPPTINRICAQCHPPGT
jgi:hypothetical protein